MGNETLPLRDEPQDLAAMAEQGVELCRMGNWSEGIKLLEIVEYSEDEVDHLPELYYSCLGYGLVRMQGRNIEGLEYCRKAIRVGFYQPENFLLLAKTYLHLKNRRGAVHTINRGLRLNPEHQGLLTLRRSLGIRRRPTIPFLPRHASINRILGQLRHRWRT